MKNHALAAFVMFPAFAAACWAADVATQPALTQPAAVPPRAANASGDTGSHDPSRMILCDGKYYVYSTGGGMKSSIDRVYWTAGPSPFASSSPATAPATGGRRPRATIPPSVAALVPQNQGIWAPDVIFFNNQYYLYYSVAAANDAANAPNGRAVIGLLTSPTLDPASPKYKWTDAGVVIATENKTEKRCAIDPAPFVDAKGNLWLAWGSGYANGNNVLTDPTILISKLDNTTGLASKEDPKQYPVAPGHIEASYVHYHDGFYYAFWNDGGCCNGTSSTYRIHVARSKNVTGPYVNKAGKAGAGELFMATVKSLELYGPGHMGIESEPGLDRFTFHYYNAAARPVLGVRTLVWGADAWPSVGEDLSPGTYTITAANGMALGIRGGASADGALIELQPYTGSPFQKWNVTLTPEGYYRITSAGSGKSMEVAMTEAANTSPARVDQSAARAGDHQRWIIELLSDGKAYDIKSCSTHHTLSIVEKSKTTTTNWNNLPEQKWTLNAP